MVNERGTFGAGEEGLENMLQPPHRASCDSTMAPRSVDAVDGSVGDTMRTLEDTYENMGR